MDKRSFMGLGYAAEKLLEHYTKAPPKVDINSPDSINDFISGAPQPFSNNQLLLAPLLGAGAGGLAGLAFGNPKARKRDMLVGALGGGMIGGGAALGYKYLGGAAADKARELNTVPADYVQQNQDNIKLLEDHQKSWNPLKGGLIEVNTGRPIANTEIPIRIEKLKKLRELYPQIPEAAGNYEQHRRGITGGLQGGVAGLTLAKILDTIMPYNAAKKPKPKKDKKDMDAKTQKKADALGALGGGVNLGLTGGLLGGGIGGLYGLASGALGSRKGQRIRDTLVGGARGLVGGGLLGGGAGAGLGLSLGGHVPVSDFMSGDIKRIDAARDSMKKIDPRLFAGLTTASTMGGAALGGAAANTVLNPKKDNKKPEDTNEKKDEKEAELKLAPQVGMKRPQTGAAAKHVNDIIEKARKKRETQEKAMPQQNKAAARGDATMKLEQRYKDQLSGPHESLFGRITPSNAEDFQSGGRYARLTSDSTDQHKKDVQRLTQRRLTNKDTLRKINKNEKKASAYEFGKMIKSALGLQDIGNTIKDTWNSPTVQGFVNDPTTRAGLTYGGIGAGLGGLYGLVNPGEYEDETGNVRRRGRLSGALRGALGGGALGGLAGAGAQEGRFQYLKHLANVANNASGVPAAPGMGLPTDRAGWQAYSEQFAPDYLKTSPLQSATNAYSAATSAVKGFMPKQMGKAPATGVETPAKPPEVKTTDEQR